MHHNHHPLLDDESIRNLPPLHQRHLAAAVNAASAAGTSMPGSNITGAEQLYSNLYGKEIGMMRKMVNAGGSMDDTASSFARTAGPQNTTMISHPQTPHNHHAHNNLPPNMIPENMIYNPKFAQQQQQQPQHGHPSHPQGGFNFHPPGMSDSHLHKMEGLLKPCYDTGNNGHFAGFNNSSNNSNNNHFPPSSNHHHHHLASQQQHYPNSNNNGNSSNNLVESPHFVNNNFSSNTSNNNNNNNSSINKNNLNANGLPENALIKQENHDDFHNFTKQNVKNEPNDFNSLGYASGINNNGNKTKEELNDLHNDDSIDKLSALNNDNDRSP
ncbi:GATA zinc finger domain-containing protein 16-like [Culicoides brevitarsis]|uniref:GATA zinc finger domain-containing protein 16-like n=1 Tax=Culicoides brevitarsis TaxID=469753 RepID=UPI00307B6F0E